MEYTKGKPIKSLDNLMGHIIKGHYIFYRNILVIDLTTIKYMSFEDVYYHLQAPDFYEAILK